LGKNVFGAQGTKKIQPFVARDDRIQGEFAFEGDGKHVGFDLDDEILLAQQAVDHLGIAEVVGEFLVIALHLIALGEFHRLEVNVVEAKRLAQF
jgi:hypothetical protein